MLRVAPLGEGDLAAARALVITSGSLSVLLYCSEVQRQLGRPVKDTVEIASFGSVRQSAYRATSRQRLLLDDDGAPELHVLPGSFIEFISRDRIGEGANKHLDLRFDAGNAQGIFKMTASGIGQFDLRKSGIEK